MGEAWLAAGCPTCGAPALMPCASSTPGAPRLARPHAARVAAARVRLDVEPAIDVAGPR